MNLRGREMINRVGDKKLHKFVLIHFGGNLCLVTLLRPHRHQKCDKGPHDTAD